MSKKHFQPLIILLLATNLFFWSCKSKKTASVSAENGKKPGESKNLEVSRKGDDTSTVYVLISTSFGNMKAKLYNQTPRHRDNFVKLVKEGFYDSLLFHRIINQFMIQGGDPESKHAAPGAMLGNGDVGYTIPAEFNPSLFHKKGALCAARQGDDVNPLKASSGCQFYIVQGKTFNENDLTQMEYRVNRPLFNKIAAQVMNDPANAAVKAQLDRLKAEGKRDSMLIVSKGLDAQMMKIYSETPHFEYNAVQKETYKTIGGTPHLDGGYTVFGEVIEGLEVIDKIAGQATGANDRPQQDIRMKISIIKK